MDRQVARLTAWAIERDLAVGQVVCEVGSGLNGKRPGLRRILSDPDAMVIVVEHRDRLAASGSNTLRRRGLRKAAGSWSPTRVKPPMIWCAT